MSMVDPASAAAASSDSSSGLSLGSAATLGVGALGFGALLGMGEGSLPAEYGQLEASVPQLQQEAGLVEGQGGALVNQGTQALQMAQKGELTPEQQAQLSVYSTGLTNKSRQEYASMGRNPDQDTSYVNTQANIDTQVNAMAQQQIQSTIQLGLGEISAGNSLDSTGLGFSNAANQALIAAGEAQIKLDQSYSSSLTAAFSAIGTMAGAAFKLSDARMKQNISEIGALFDGTPVYRFQYLDSPDWEVGVMAQDIEKFAPEAVHDIGGVKYVDIERATERALRA